MKRALILTVIAPLAFSNCAEPQHPLGVRQATKGVIKPDGTAPLERGRILFAQKEYGLAVEAFRRATREAPEDPAGFNGLAASYDMIGRFDLSRRYYELALAMAPEDVRLYRNLARSLEMQGKADEAKSLWAEAESVAAGVRSRQLAASVPETVVAQTAPVQASEQAAPIAPVAPVQTAMQTPVQTASVTPPPAKPVGQQSFNLKSGYEITVALEEPPRPATPTRLALAPKPDQPRPSLERVDRSEVLVHVPAPRATSSFRPIIGQQVTVSLDAPAEKRPVAAVPQAIIATRPAKAKLAAIVVERPIPNANRPMLAILNASNQPGMARRLSVQLADRGWGRATVSGTKQRFAESWLVYPASAKKTAQGLQKKLPFATRIVFDRRVDRVVLLLGANASGYARAPANKGQKV